VVAAIHDESVSVNLNNGRYLTISIMNSPLKALGPDQKEAKAREIALLAYKAFASRQNLERVGIVFVEQRRSFLVFSYTDATDYHGFPAKDLARDGAASPSSRTRSGAAAELRARGPASSETTPR
jgi:hypothetical protein